MTERQHERRRSNLVVAGYSLALLVAAYPALRMSAVVLDASPLQHADYWQLLDRFMTAGGGLDIGGLFHFNNEHPVVLPQLLLWANIELFNGSNVALGLIDVAVSLGQLAVLGLVIRRSRMSPLQQMTLFVLSSALVFSLLGTWNYAKAMSGVAWLTANLFALGAVYLCSRQRRIPAVISGVIATASYGTGIAVWPALVLTGISIRRGQRWWSEWPFALGFAISAVWYQVANTATKGDSNEPLAVIRAMAGLFGFVLGLGGDAGELVGGVVLIATPAACVVALRTQRRGPAPWVGIATFAWLATLLISLGRNETLRYFGSNRYTSLPALTWIGLVGLLVSLGHAGRTDRSPAGSLPMIRGISSLLIAALAIRAGTVGNAHVDDMLALNGEQERREIALRLGLGEENAFVGGFGIELPRVTGLMRSVSHHPFREWGLDCGLLGTDAATIPLTAGDLQAGQITSAGPLRELVGAVAIDGTVDPRLDIRCLVIVDESGMAVGAATLADAPGTFRGIAAGGSDVYRAVVFVEQDPDPRVLDGEYRPSGEGG